MLFDSLQYIIFLPLAVLIYYLIPYKFRWFFFLLATSMTVNLGILFFFKYFNFINSSIQDVFSQFNVFYDKPEFHVLLPVGISFYTFQVLSYTLEVYQGKQKPEKHFGYF